MSVGAVNRLADLRHGVETNPYRAKDAVLAFLRDNTLREAHEARDNLYFRGVMELKSLRGSTQDPDELRGKLRGLLDEAERQIDARSESANQIVQQRLKAREDLHGRKIDKRTAFRCSGLGKRYPDFELRGVDLDLKLGEITGC